jgi:hypothetical protein
MSNTTTVAPAADETGPRHVSGEGESMTAGARDADASQSLGVSFSSLALTKLTFIYI